MENRYQARTKILITLLPALLLILFVLGFLGQTFLQIEPDKKVTQVGVQKSEGEKVKFLVFGDSGSGSSEQKKLAVLMEKEKPDFVLHTGDLAYERGSQQEINDKVVAVYENLFKQAAFYPVLGNHDYLTEKGQPFINTFELPGNERYYSFSLGGILFVALDSNDPLDETTNQMLSWLESTLSERESKNLWTIVYFHHPPYSSGTVHGSDRRVEEKIVPILEKYQVDIVFNGHEHNYQRSCEIANQKCDRSGILYVVTGGGGRSLYPVGVPQWFTEFQKATYHFIAAEKDSCNLYLKAIDLAGEVFDKVTKSKC